MLSLQVFRLVSIKPQAKNKVRLTKVLAWSTQPQALQYLKRTSLAMQLCHHTHSICAQLQPEATPKLVELVDGKVRRAADADFKRISTGLVRDPALDHTPAVTVLVGVLVDTQARFRQYEQWPFKLCQLCSTFNTEHMDACVKFLRAPDEELDSGFSLPLKQLALSWGSNAAALKFLTGHRVQALLRAAFTGSGASSLPAERKFAEAKRSEAPRLCHIATASRNHMLRLFHRWREAHVAAIQAAERACAMAQKTNVASLAWQARADLLPRPGPSSSRRMPINEGGNFEALSAARVSQDAQLKRRVAQLRAEAADALASARGQVDGPVTMSDWAQWFDTNRDSFTTALREAGQLRRAVNRRLVADETLPTAPRARPSPDADSAAPVTVLFALLRRRRGWHVMRLSPPARMRLLFLWPYNGITWVNDVTPAVAPGVPQQRSFAISCEAQISGVPLSKFSAAVAETVAAAAEEGIVVRAEVFEVAIQAVPSAEKLDVSIRDLQPVLMELPRRLRRRKQATRAESEDSSHSSESELPGHRSVDSASTPEVETDLDDGLSGDSSDADIESPQKGDKEAPLSGDDANKAAAGDDVAQQAAPRHPRHTWTVYANLWWRVVSHPHASDVRINLTGALESAGVGYPKSKQLTPGHFGESKPEVPRCALLLRCWSLWRLQQGEWLNDPRYPYRKREFAVQLQALRQDLLVFQRQLPPGSAFLGNAAAANQAAKWTPTLVKDIAAATGRPSAAGASTGAFGAASSFGAPAGAL